MYSSDPILSQWDRRNDSSSRGTLLFHSLWPRVQKITGLIASAAPERPLEARPVELDAERSKLLIAAMEQTMAELQKLELKGDEPWGTLLAARTAAGNVPLHGGAKNMGVLNTLDAAPLTSKGFTSVVNGSAYLQLAT